MSKPAIVPETTASGIAVDPRTLERVIPESRRPDGTIRKEKKIRPGYTPQEDVRRFRGTRQAQMDVNTLPKGHIIGWAPPPSVTLPPPKAGSAALTKAQKKNEKRKEKRKEKHEEVKVKDNWEDEDEDELKEAAESTSAAVEKTKEAEASKGKEAGQDVEGLADKLEKLEVQ